jgi:hypothetical protein
MLKSLSCVGKPKRHVEKFKKSKWSDSGDSGELKGRRLMAAPVSTRYFV